MGRPTRQRPLGALRMKAVFKRPVSILCRRKVCQAHRWLPQLLRISAISRGLRFLNRPSRRERPTIVGPGPGSWPIWRESSFPQATGTAASPSPIRH
jgi:hypothetical protein